MAWIRFWHSMAAEKKYLKPALFVGSCTSIVRSMCFVLIKFAIASVPDEESDSAPVSTFISSEVRLFLTHRFCENEELVGMDEHNDAIESN